MSRNRKILIPITIVYYKSRFLQRSLRFGIRQIFRDFKIKNNIDYKIGTLINRKGKYVIDDGVSDFEIYIGNKLIKSFSKHIIREIEQIFSTIEECINQNEKEILRIYNRNLEICEILEENRDYKSLYLFYKENNEKKSLYYLKKANKLGKKNCYFF